MKTPRMWFDELLKGAKIMTSTGMTCGTVSQRDLRTNKVRLWRSHTRWG